MVYKGYMQLFFCVHKSKIDKKGTQNIKRGPKFPKRSPWGPLGGHDGHDSHHNSHNDSLTSTLMRASWEESKSFLFKFLHSNTFNMLNGLTTVRTAILRILQSKIEKGDPRHKKGTQDIQRGPKFPKRSPRGPRSPKGDPFCNSGIFESINFLDGS